MAVDENNGLQGIGRNVSAQGALLPSGCACPRVRLLTRPGGLSKHAEAASLLVEASCHNTLSDAWKVWVRTEIHGRVNL